MLISLGDGNTILMVLVDGVGGGVTVLGCVGRVSGTIKEKA